MTEKRNFVAPLTQYLRDNGLSDVALGKRLGVSSQTVLHWRHGNKIPNRKNMRALAEISKGKLGPADFYQ